MLQHRPFVDLGLEHVNLKTKTVQDMVKELQKNGGNLQNTESVEVLRASLGANIELLSQLQYQKSNLYTPKGRPSTVGSARPLPGVPKPSLIQLMQQQQQETTKLKLLEQVLLQVFQMLFRSINLIQQKFLLEGLMITIVSQALQ